MNTEESGSEIRDLYPNLTKEQIKEVEKNLEAYLEPALRIYERVKADPREYDRFKVLLDLWRKEE